MKHLNRTTRGFSLLELLLVVAVGAVLILAGLGAYQLVSKNNAANQSLRQLQTLKSAIQEAYGPGQNFDADPMGAMIDAKKVPADMPVTTAATPWGVRNAAGNDTFASGATDGATGESTFALTFKAMPEAACNKLARAYQTDTSSDLVSVKVGGATMNDSATTKTADEIAAACVADAVTGGQDVVLTFRHQ